MLFAILSKDDPEQLSVRGTHSAEHVSYLEQHTTSILAAGALRREDGAVPMGGLWIVEAQSAQATQALVEADSFFREGLHLAVHVRHWGRAAWSDAFAACVTAHQADQTEFAGSGSVCSEEALNSWRCG
jgi:uncharacterized protein YciI